MPTAATREKIEAGLLVLGLIALLYFSMRQKSPPPTTAADVSGQPNQTIDHAGEAGTEYYNYNYPAVEGQTALYYPPGSNGANAGNTNPNNSGEQCGAPTCGCSDTFLLSGEQEFQRYLQARLSGFIDVYEKDVLSFIPSWFRQYLTDTGRAISTLQPINYGSAAPRHPIAF